MSHLTDAIARAMRGPPLLSPSLDVSLSASELPASSPSSVPSLLPPAPAPMAPVSAAATKLPPSCSMCGQPVNDDDDRVVRGACRHVCHTACAVPLLQARRHYCVECPAPALSRAEAQSRGGYSIDAGNDADMRESVLAALEYRRERVRDDIIARALTRIGAADVGRGGSGGGGAAAVDVISNRRRVTNIEATLYDAAAVPRAPGGVPDKRVRPGSARSCADPNCGGPRFCVHRYMLPVDRRAVLLWRLFDVELPVAPALNDMVRARECVDRLFSVRAPPSAFVRCGADAERLAVLGYDIDSVVRDHVMLIEHVVAAFELDWSRLLAWGFDIRLLVYRQAFPVVALVREPIRASAQRLLESFVFNYADLVDRCHLTHEELFVLGFDASLLVELGMTPADVANALEEETTKQRGFDWWARAMHWEGRNCVPPQ